MTMTLNLSQDKANQEYTLAKITPPEAYYENLILQQNNGTKD